MTPNEASNRFEQLKRLFEEQIPELIRINGITLVANVKERINLRGVNAFGRGFPPYTKEYEKWKSGGYRIQSSKKVLKSGKLSKGKKRPDKFVGFRNLELTGSMLQDFKIFKEGNDYVMGFPNDKMEERAAQNSKYADVDNIIQPSEQELEKLYADFNAGLDKLIKKIFV